jgi:hypothetical protein
VADRSDFGRFVSVNVALGILHFDARRDRQGRGAAVDQLGSLNVVTALLLAYRGGDVFR